MGGSVAAVPGHLSDAIRSVWAFKIVGYDAERQERDVYSWIRYFAGLAMTGFALIGQMLRDAMKWLYFENPAQFFSVRGFFRSRPSARWC